LAQNPWLATRCSRFTYDPATGRFLGRDPLSGLDPAHHPYSYASNNPTTNSDPSGLCDVDGAELCQISADDEQAAHASALDAASAGDGSTLGPGADEQVGGPIYSVAAPAVDSGVGAAPEQSCGPSCGPCPLCATPAPMPDQAPTPTPVPAPTPTPTPTASTTPPYNLYGPPAPWTLGWGDLGTLIDHFNRHGGDFGAQSASEYAIMAQNFLQTSVSLGMQIKIANNGVIRVWDPVNRWFGSYNPDGSTRTFFIPDPNRYPGDTYWFQQPGSAPPAGWIPPVPPGWPPH
jgi:uncharacterized protein RhaS with RHS repeats